MTDATAGQSATAAPVTASYRRYALTVLLIIYTLNFLDRQIMNTLAEPIKQELGLSDTALGLMTGLAFAIFYTVLGIPIARLAERANRPLIISTAVAVWSGFTVLCGFAQNFVQMVLARIGVGVGEAGCTPPAHSLIMDYVPREKRASAMAFYSLGTPIGTLLGMIIGGIVADIWGWRVAFMVAGAPGVIIALVAAFTLIEPRNRIKTDLAAQKAAQVSFGDAMRELTTKRTFWLLAFACSIKAFIGYGSGAFIISFFLRNHPEEAGAYAAYFGMGTIGFVPVTIGLMGGIAGVFGTWLGGALSDRYGANNLKFNVVMPAVATLIAIPFYVAGLLVGDFLLAAFLVAIPAILNTLWYGPIYSSVQGLVRPQTRATAAAILLFIINLIGLGLGPLGIGVISDLFAGPLGFGVNEGLRWSLISFYVIGASAFFLFWFARHTIEKEMVS
jgi:MFS family permease